VETLDAVQKIAGSDSAHVMTSCSGGILAAMTAAHLAAQGAAERSADSWWPDYLGWLTARAGDEVEVPQALGAEAYPPLGPAPGTYVLQK
jgi:poly(3-hydroxyalkanoate) synthetase